jgi:hypothetical protein
MTVDKNTSSLAIYGYALNTSKVDTRLSRPVVSLKALNAIYRTTSLSIPGNLITMIW